LEFAEKSAAAQGQLLSLPIFQQAGVLALYSPVRNEVETAGLLNAALAAGKTVCYPCVTGDDLNFYPVHGPADLHPGCFGIREPEVKMGRIDPATLDFLLVPGVAFDRSGYRLGYGRGYFDRFLTVNRLAAVTVGFCFDFQIVEKLPSEAHDQSVALLVSEKRIYSPLSLDDRVNHRLC
jgi:5-formyltetrahydrofolate cyclo-ligase